MTNKAPPRYRLFCATWTDFPSESGLPALPQTAASARALSSALHELDLLSEEPVRMVNRTGVACIGGLEDFLANPGDDIILYLASHGLVSPGDNPLFRLATCDTRESGDLTRALPLVEITKRLGRCNARRKFLVLDACFSGRPGSSLYSQVVGESQLSSGLCLLSSSTPLEAAKADKDEPLTAFAASLIEVLRSGLPGRPSSFSAAELAAAVEERQVTLKLPRPWIVSQGKAAQALVFRNAAAGDIDPEPFNAAAARYDYRAEVLYVDDEEEPRATFQEALERAGHRVTTVDAAPAAAVELERSHFDIIVLDLLVGSDDPATDLINLCTKQAPDSMIFVVSRRDMGTNRTWSHLHRIFAHPNRISAFIWKSNYLQQITGYANRLRSRRQHVLAKVNNLEPTVTLVAGRMINRDESLLDQSEAIQLEVRVAVEQLVENWLAPEEGHTFIESVSLRPVDSGKSRCAVFTMIPRLRSVTSSDVMPLILKVGPAEEIEQEQERYDRYVQVGVPLDLRTDKIAATTVGRVGGILYSFRGGHNGIVEEMDQLGSEEIARCLDVIFNPHEGRKWFATRVENRVFPLDHYEELGFPDFKPAVEQMRVSIDRLLPDDLAPSGDAASPFWLKALDEEPPVCRDQPATLVHGDLNLGNVVRCDDGRYAMIDYRTVGIGPRLVDFATIEVACWLTAQGPVGRDRKELFVEARSAVAPTFEDLRPLDDIPDWLRSAWGLAHQCRRLAMENTEHSASVAEYAALLWLAAVRRSDMKSAKSTSEKNAHRVLLPALALAAQHMLVPNQAAA